ncbi:hypothetical protein [Nostoc sp. UIC 10630]|uniref:hypothetical protein n=1 Tax=Nostoc sp. UIC 10630 TaxID=2100146 RepID=UPI0013D65950|nr:hypothetical protein [Nostoc sp. UIC 10630]NEU79360.1 hypothetical protein [Nostoc sp. UIC 10630]
MNCPDDVRLFIKEGRRQRAGGRRKTARRSRTRSKRSYAAGFTLRYLSPARDRTRVRLVGVASRREEKGTRV